MDASFLYEYELTKSAEVLVREMFKVQAGETFAITADTQSDPRVVNATAQAVYAAGGKPMVIRLPTPEGVSLAADPMLPVDSLAAALSKVDCWVEFNRKWLLFSTPYNIAKKENLKLRYMNLTGLNVSSMVQCIGKVDYPKMKLLLEKVADLVRNTKHMRMTSKAGEDVEFINLPKRPVSCELGYADTPGTHMMAGQVAWTPDLETLNGVIVLDGSVAPDIGALSSAVTMHVKKGVIEKIEGGRQAAAYEAWMRSFNHPQMLRIAHAGFGFNPGASITGDILQDQRVWGSTTWGVGSIGPNLIPPQGVYGPSHSDAVSLNTTVYFDGKLILENGEFVDEELKELAKPLKK